MQKPRAGLAVVLVALAASGCSSETAQLEIRPVGTPRFVPFHAHNVLAGYQLDQTVTVRESRGVDVVLTLIAVGAADLGTGQAWLTNEQRGDDLRERGLLEVSGRGAVTFRPALGLVANAPRGPVELILAVQGTDASGNAVSDFQVVTLDATPP